ncbi:GNAT family N-acetyltransferase, partial [Schumannella luteola]
TDTGLALVEAWEGVGHPEGAYVARVPDDATLAWRTSATPHGLLHVGIPFERAPDAPPLWFLAIDESHGRAPSATIAAYTGDQLPDGTIVGSLGFARLGVPADAQLGEVRWFRDGLVHHIHVDPAFRRRDIGTSLLHAAGAWQQANRWPGYLHARRPRNRLVRRFLDRFDLPGRISD